MRRPQILSKEAGIVERLRVHAARMLHDSAANEFHTEAWEFDDLTEVLDDAADLIERLKGGPK